MDHLLLATPDLLQTVADLERLLGVRPVFGGSHPGKGTQNYLLGFSDKSYLEIIGPDPDQPGVPPPIPLDQVRLVTWALCVPDISVHSPISVERITPDGTVLRGRVTTDFDGPVPFLIDWGDTPHPAASLPRVDLVSFTLVHPTLREVYGVQVQAGLKKGLIAVVKGRDQTVVLTS